MATARVVQVLEELVGEEVGTERGVEVEGADDTVELGPLDPLDRTAISDTTPQVGEVEGVEGETMVARMATA